MNASKVERRLRLYVVALFVATGVLLLAAAALDVPLEPRLPVQTLPVLLVALVAAEILRVRFRGRSYNDALTLFEAVLAPLIFSFPTPIVVATVGVAQIVTALIRRSELIKGSFNTAQWMFAAAVGSMVAEQLGVSQGLTLSSLASLVIALLVVSVVNMLATLVVRAIAEGQSAATAVKSLAPVIVSVGLGWLVNLLFGLLFVLAAAGHPAATVLFPVPLILLNQVYRGYTAAQADGRRLAGLHAAAQVLSEPLYPLDAINAYLDEVRESFDARGAVLILRREDGLFETYISASVSSDGVDGDGAEIRTDRPASPAEQMLAAREEPIRVKGSDTGPLVKALAKEGWRDCSCAPLIDDHQQLGVLAVFDQTGFEGTDTAELAVLEALARETAHTLARGRLFESVVEQERKLAQIVSTTSDGIFTLADTGELLTWNNACANITGYTEQELLGRRDLMRTLAARTATGKPVDFANWVTVPSLPREVLISTAVGAQRRLSCSANTATDVDGVRSLVVVARDITPADEYEELREQFGQLVEVQAAQRLVVDHLQQAVAPEPPGIDGADIAVAYVASDPASPTGGDLFDWHALPNGDLHVAVVDVLGHGVTATKDALTVVHTLRFVAIEGTDLQDVVGRADELLCAQDTELVATVVVARYNPETGELKVVSGGHPPALVVGPGGEVRQLSATGGAIGWPGVGSDNVATTFLGVHDSMVLYTDGLIEARKDIIEGMDSLTKVAAEVCHMPAQQYADELVRRALAGADRRDDTLALVLRRTRKSVVADSKRWHLDPGAHENFRQARKELESWLRAHSVEADDIVLVAAELIANASSAARTEVVMTAQVGAGHVIIEVSDDGEGTNHLEDLGRRLPGNDSERGRGLYLVRALSQEVSVMSTTEGTLVRSQIAARGITAASKRLHGERRSY